MLHNLNFYPHQIWDPGFSKCKVNHCRVCQYAKPGKVIYGTRATKFELLYQNLNCTTENVVYSISCKKCEDIMYIGETGRTLNIRIGEHLTDILENHVSPVSIHFNQENHNIADFIFTALRSLNSNNGAASVKMRCKRLKLENHFMNKFQTLQPKGLNTKMNAVKEPLFMVLPYSKNISKLANIIRRGINEKTDIKVCPSYQKHKNIKEVLCPSKFR